MLCAGRTDPTVDNVKQWADKNALFEPEEAAYPDSGSTLETTDNDDLGWRAVHPS
jgi:hypothetical protein